MCVCCRQEIVEKLVGQAVRLSQHKFASNVVEKCLQFGSPAGRQVCSHMSSHIPITFVKQLSFRLRAEVVLMYLVPDSYNHETVNMSKMMLSYMSNSIQMKHQGMLYWFVEQKLEAACNGAEVKDHASVYRCQFLTLLHCWGGTNRPGKVYRLCICADHQDQADLIGFILCIRRRSNPVHPWTV